MLEKLIYAILVRVPFIPYPYPGGSLAPDHPFLERIARQLADEA